MEAPSISRTAGSATPRVRTKWATASPRTASPVTVRSTTTAAVTAWASASASAAPSWAEQPTRAGSARRGRARGRRIDSNRVVGLSMGRNKRVVVLAAFAPELEGLEGAFPSDVVGVGMVHAALGAARAAAPSGPARPDLAILVGTCGAYPSSGLRVGHVVEATGHVLADGAALEGRAALVDAMLQRLDATATLGAGTPALVATTLGITTDDGLAALIGRRTGAAVEHLEAFAVASAFAAAGVPLAVVLGVANAVGGQGRAEWRQHHRAAGVAAVTAVRRALGA